MNCSPSDFDAGAAYMTAFFLVLLTLITLCQVIATVLEGSRWKWLARVSPEWVLIRYGLWCECSGDPFNAWAEEFDRRDEQRRLSVPATKKE